MEKNMESILSIIASLIAIISGLMSWKNSKEINKLKNVNSNNSIKGKNNNQVNGSGKIISGK